MSASCRRYCVWVILAGALAVRLIGASRPLGCYRLEFEDDYDEVWYGGNAMTDMLRGRRGVHAETGQVLVAPLWPVHLHPPLAFWAEYVFVRLLGWSPLKVRLVHILAGVVTIWLMIRLGTMYHPWGGLLSGVWGATCTYLVHFQHTAVLESILTGLLMAYLCALCSHGIGPRRAGLKVAGATAFLLLACFTKLSALLFAPALVVVLARGSKSRLQGRALRLSVPKAACLIAATAAALLALVYVCASFRPFEQALEKLQFGLNGIAEPFRLDYLVWLSVWCGPLLVFAPVGLGVLWRSQRQSALALSAVIVIGIGFPFALAEQYRRWLVPTVPVLIVLGGLGAARLLERAAGISERRKRRIAVVGLVGLIVLSSAQGLFVLVKHVQQEVTCEQTDPYISQIDDVANFCVQVVAPGDYVMTTDMQAGFYVAHTRPTGFDITARDCIRTRDLCFWPAEGVATHRPPFVLLDRTTVAQDPRPALRSNIKYVQENYRVVRRFPPEGEAAFILYRR